MASFISHHFISRWQIKAQCKLRWLLPKVKKLSLIQPAPLKVFTTQINKQQETRDSCELPNGQVETELILFRQLNSSGQWTPCLMETNLKVLSFSLFHRVLTGSTGRATSTQSSLLRWSWDPATSETLKAGANGHKFWGQLGERRVGPRERK